MLLLLILILFRSIHLLNKEGSWRIRRNWHNIAFLLFIAFTLFTCVDPYTPRLDKFESLLVVDGLLTDENKSNYVRLSRTFDTLGKEPERISGAMVTIKDDLGNSTVLNEIIAGEYRTDSTTFMGITGRTYTLHIMTIDGNEYESEPCIMNPVPDIDSLYFAEDQVLSEKTGETLEGVRIYIDSNGESASNYYRWTYEEWWKFSVPEVKEYNYINDSTILPIAEVKKICWENRKSDEIIIRSTISAATDAFEKNPVHFVASEETNHLLIQYCIEVRQMSISQEEYAFWDLMTHLHESGGDIFDNPPFQVFSNIKSITNPVEQVVGYFQVAGAKKKRIYITVNDVIDLDLPLYRYKCEMFEKGIIDYPPPKPPDKGVWWDDIYSGFTNSGFTFTKPTFTLDGRLLRLVFVRPFCADCTLNGSLNKPDFWVDIE
jgi:hypothetical protein